MCVEVANKPFEIGTHNGCITVVNPETGNHRTLRIRTISEKSKFAPGARVVELLIGSNNEEDYLGFGFVVDGEVRLWRKREHDKAYQWYARFLSHPERFTGFEVRFEGRCRRCNLLLTDPVSIDLGIGPTCREKE